MLNSVNLQGRLAADPNFRKTKANVSYVSFTLVVERPKTATSDKINDFIPCFAWDKTAEYIFKWFNKGDMVVVSGCMQSRKYRTPNGRDCTAYEVKVNECNFCNPKTPTHNVNGVDDMSEDYARIDWDSIPNKPEVY